MIRVTLLRDPLRDPLPAGLVMVVGRRAPGGGSAGLPFAMYHWTLDREMLSLLAIAL
jgi:hypothetical protein